MTALRNRPAAQRRLAFVLSVELLATLLGGVSRRAEAWVYPEHRDVTMLAVQHLDSDRAAVFQQLWAQARAGAENRLCAAGADSTQGLTPACIDWAAWPAIAGDHSCSSAQMLATAREAPWILGVADVAAQLKVDLARIAAAAPASGGHPHGSQRAATTVRDGIRSRRAHQRAAHGRPAPAAHRS